MKKGCYFIGAPGGAGAVTGHFKALGEELARRGNVVKMLFPRGAGAASGSDGGNPEFLSWPSPRPTRLADAVFLAKLVRRHRPDCLIASFAAVNWMCVVGWLAKVPFRIAWYHTMSEASTFLNNSSFVLRLQRLRKRWVYHCSSVIVPVSEAAQADVCRCYHVNPKKCRVALNSMSDPLKGGPILDASEREDFIICAAHLGFGKGQDVLIRALPALKRTLKTVRVRFLGGGERLPELKRLATDLGVEGCCDFQGHVSRQQVLHDISRACLSVLPTRAEAASYVLIESLAFGTPIVASKVGGIPEIIRDGVDGYLVPPDDAETLAGILVKLLGNPALRERLGQSGRQRFLECYELSKVVIGQTDWLESLSIN